MCADADICVNQPQRAIDRGHPRCSRRFWHWHAGTEPAGSSAAIRKVSRSESFYDNIRMDMVWLFILGGTGGNLVYEYGINVRGVNALLP